jgi:hypothetical protein
LERREERLVHPLFKERGPVRGVQKFGTDGKVRPGQGNGLEGLVQEKGSRLAGGHGAGSKD